MENTILPLLQEIFLDRSLECWEYSFSLPIYSLLSLDLSSSVLVSSRTSLADRVATMNAVVIHAMLSARP